MQQTERAISAGNMAGLVKIQEEDREVAFANDTSIFFYQISHFKDLTDHLVSLKVFLLEF
jgi:hypothetical protein